MYDEAFQNSSVFEARFKNSPTLTAMTVASVLSLAVLTSPTTSAHAHGNHSWNKDPHHIKGRKIDGLSLPKIKAVNFDEARSSAGSVYGNLNKRFKLAKLISQAKSVNINAKKKELLKEIFEEYISSDFLLRDEELNFQSFFHALKFLIGSSPKYSLPSYNVYPDGEFGFTWGKREAMLTLSFSENVIRYAYYSIENGARSKGQIPQDSFKSIAKNSVNHAPEVVILETLLESLSV